MENTKIIEKKSYIDPVTGYGVEFINWREKKYVDGLFCWRGNATNYMKVFKDTLIDSRISDASLGKFYKIIHMCGTNNVLRNKYGKPLWITDLSRLFGISSSAAYKLVKEWALFHLVRGFDINSQKMLMVNPAFGMYGRKISDLTIYVFQDYVYDTIKSKEIKRQIRWNCLFTKKYDKELTFILPEKGVLDGQIRITADDIKEKTYEYPRSN